MWIVYLIAIVVGVAFPPLGITLGVIFLLIGWGLKKSQGGMPRSGYSTRPRTNARRPSAAAWPYETQEQAEQREAHERFMTDVAPGHLWSRGDRRHN